MRKNKSKVFQAIMIIALIINTSSCTNNKSKDTKDISEEHNEAKFNKTENETDAQFLVNAAEINMEEISLGQLAQQKGNMNRVKELGKMMEDAHTKSMAELTAMARKKNISLPTSQTESGNDAYEKLNKKSGDDFGKEYSSMMVNGHKKAIELFEKAVTDCTDPDIKAWAKATLPTLRTHLDKAMTCQQECYK